mgnify:CR=1 FL=1
MNETLTPELLRLAKETAKLKIRPMKIGGRDCYLGLVHPDWLKKFELTSREKYKIESRGKRFSKRLEMENEGFTEKLKMFGEDILMLGLKV